MKNQPTRRIILTDLARTNAIWNVLACAYISTPKSFPTQTYEFKHCTQTFFFGIRKTTSVFTCFDVSIKCKTWGTLYKHVVYLHRTRTCNYLCTSVQIANGARRTSWGAIEHLTPSIHPSTPQNSHTHTIPMN